MKQEMTPFERYMRNSLKKQKQEEDQKILDKMLEDLKKQHEKERTCKINFLQKQLEKIIGV